MIAANEQEQRATVIKEAQSWLGTPFHDNACIKHVGVDCGRFLVAVYGAAGIRVPDLSDLAVFPHGWFLHRDRARYLDVILQFISTEQHGMQIKSKRQKPLIN